MPASWPGFPPATSLRQPASATGTSSHTPRTVFKFGPLWHDPREPWKGSRTLPRRTPLGRAQLRPRDPPYNLSPSMSASPTLPTTADPTAAILLIGNEILSGKVEDENARFLTRELRALGVALRRIEVVPDVTEEIAASVRALAPRFDLVFTSGG